MKKMKKILAIVLSFVMIVSASGFTTASADFADDVSEFASDLGVKLLDGLFTTLLGAVNFFIPDDDNFIDAKDRVSEYFYEGTKEFVEEATEDSCWYLGYSQISLVPDDWKEKDYFLGGYIDINNGFVNKVETIVDDMRARVIAISDNTGRGVSVFATIDCIGMTNSDIRVIRKALEDLDVGVKINSVNVTCTHCHSGIDTEGLWTNLFPKVIKNLFTCWIPGVELDTGVDMDYMAFLTAQTAKAMKAAIDDMQPGTMTYAVKDIGEDYFNNKNRASSDALITDMSRFVFRPADESKRPTMIVNIAAHPDVAGLPTNDGQSTGRELSGDYVYYMGEMIEGAGYNFMFFNGAIAGIYMARGASNDGVDFEHRYEQSIRYGHELGRIALSLTLTKEEVSNDPYITNWDEIKADMEESGEHYSLWFENWTKVTERELEPIFNIRHAEVEIPVNNPFIQLAGKLRLANYTVCRTGWKSYVIYSEIGYMEMGDVKIAIMPGEVCQDLVVGGSSLTAEGSYTGTEFGYATIADLFGEDTVCFGIANDAIGYVIPDNDYAMAIVGDHYHELISLGDRTASSIMIAFAKLAEEVK